MDGQDHAKCGVRPFHLLAQQGEGDVVHAGATVALGDGQTQEALRAHLLEDVRS